jgi:hypothetical protein
MFLTVTVQQMEFFSTEREHRRVQVVPDGRQDGWRQHVHDVDAHEEAPPRTGNENIFAFVKFSSNSKSGEYFCIFCFPRTQKVVIIFVIFSFRLTQNKW